MWRRPENALGNCVVILRIRAVLNSVDSFQIFQILLHFYAYFAVKLVNK